MLGRVDFLSSFPSVLSKSAEAKLRVCSRWTEPKIFTGELWLEILLTPDLKDTIVVQTVVGGAT